MSASDRLDIVDLTESSLEEMLLDAQNFRGFEGIIYMATIERLEEMLECLRTNLQTNPANSIAYISSNAIAFTNGSKITISIIHDDWIPKAPSGYDKILLDFAIDRDTIKHRWRIPNTNSQKFKTEMLCKKSKTKHSDGTSKALDDYLSEFKILSSEEENHE